jgi:hypothetical protein
LFGAAVIGGMSAVSIGAAAGWIGGQMLGNSLFPEQVNGPKLQDLHTQISSYGGFIPQVWGRFRLGANIVWATDLEPHENTTGGKGGGPEVTTTTYTASFDAVICRTPHSGTIRLLRIWAYGRLIYDNRTGTAVTGSELPFVFYDGNDDQEADPTEESIIGAGLVPAYIGVARVVFTDLDLSEFGNTIPQLNFEVSTAVDEQPLSRSAAFEVIVPTANPLTDHRSVGYDEDGNIVVAYWVTDSVVTPNYLATATTCIWRVKVYDPDGTLLSTTDTDEETADAIPSSANIFLCRNEPTLSYVRGLYLAVAAGRWFKNGVMINTPVDAGFGSSYYSVNEEFVYHDGNVFAVAGNADAYLVRYPAPSAVPNPTYDARITLATGFGHAFTLTVSTDGFIYVNIDSELRKYDTNLTLLQTWDTSSGVVPVGVFPRGGWFVCGDKLLLRKINVGSDGDYVLYQMFDDPVAWVELARIPLVDSTPPLNGQLWSLGDGMCLVEDGLLSVCFIDTATVLHGDIVADVCEECGYDPSEYDVSELIDREIGVATTGIGSGRAFIESLMPLRFYDAVDSDTATKFIKRGKPSVVTIPAGDLAARGENEEIPARLQQVRGGNDEEYPSTLYFRYYNANGDYQMGVQPWRRQTGNSLIVREISAAMVLTDADAKRIVDSLGANIWNERDAFSWSTTRDYLGYEPTDVQTVEGIELRATKKHERMAEGVIAWEGFKSRPGVFVQTGVGGASEGIEEQTIPEPQDTEALVLDIPLLPDPDRQSVVYVPMQGALRRSWRGAALMKSNDGTNYSTLLTQTSPDSIGATTTALGNHGGPAFDEANILRVRMGPGAAALTSSTRAGVLAGANLCAIGAENGGYELTHYINADLVDEEDDGSRVYDVSRFLRGRRGTEAFKRGHVIGDKFVVLPAHTILDVPMYDIGKTRQYKAVTLGRSLASADPIEVRHAGISLAALAPINTAAGFDGDGDCLMQWDRRSRISFGWLPGVPQPLGEETERYRIRIFADGTKQVVLRTDYSDTEEYTYLEAAQTTDFGAPLTVPPAWDVAQKCLTGWGWTSDGGRPTLLTEDFPGYVPPNPAPTDTEFYVNSTMPWVSGSIVNALTLAPNQTWVIAIPVGMTPTTLNDYVSLIANEYTGAPIPRIFTFSPIPGDFAPQPRPYAYNLEGTMYPSVAFQVEDDLDPGFPVVPAGDTWYFNIRTLPTNYATCPMRCSIANVP